MTKARAMRELLARKELVVSPNVYDGYSAMLVAKMGFKAAATTGAGLSNARLGLPDIGLLSMKENVEACRMLAQLLPIPLMADAETGYGNAVSVFHAVQYFEDAGVVGLNLEDQVSPKRCGHMQGKAVIPADEMVRKIRAAAGARSSSDFYIVARTDARAVSGLDEALRRGEQYLEAGADGLFIEAPETVEELAKIGRTFQGVGQFANMVEGGGQTPVLPPDELQKLGFNMVAYPVTVLFRVARVIEQSLANIKAGKPMDANAVDFKGFKDITGFAEWARIEDTYKQASSSSN